MHCCAPCITAAILMLSSYAATAFSPRASIFSSRRSLDTTAYAPKTFPTRSSEEGEIRLRWRLDSDATGGSGGGGDNYDIFGRISPSSWSTPSGHWELYNSFELFLNQCAIQSLLFLINSLRDRHTALWLEDFTQPIIHSRTKEAKGRDHVLSTMAAALNDAMKDTQTERQIRLLTYHGLGAINTTLFPTWDSYFEKLLQEPGVSYLIESSRPHVPSYTLDIAPASLCSRIISVREQIAREFVNDLDVIAESSLCAMQKYRLDASRVVKLERINQYFLEMSVHEDYVPSPLRKGNFDLLLTMTTQEAIHRILNRLFASPAATTEECKIGDLTVDQSSIQFLRNFYAQRIGTHFTGSSFYGQADDFLDELLQTMPSIVQLQDSECGLVDPEQLVEMIFKEREKVASEWLEVSLDVPKSHTAIKRWQLNKLMGIDNNPTLGDSSSFE